MFLGHQRIPLHLVGGRCALFLVLFRAAYLAVIVDTFDAFGDPFGSDPFANATPASDQNDGWAASFQVPQLTVQGEQARGKILEDLFLFFFFFLN